MDSSPRDRFETPFNSVILRGMLIAPPERIPNHHPVGTRLTIEQVTVWSHTRRSGYWRQVFHVDTLDALTLWEGITPEDLAVGDFVLCIGTLRSFKQRGGRQELVMRPLALSVQSGASNDLAETTGGPHGRR